MLSYVRKSYSFDVDVSCDLIWDSLSWFCFILVCVSLSIDANSPSEHRGSSNWFVQLMGWRRIFVLNNDCRTCRPSPSSDARTDWWCCLIRAKQRQTECTLFLHSLSVVFALSARAEIVTDTVLHYPELIWSLSTEGSSRNRHTPFPLHFFVVSPSEDWTGNTLFVPFTCDKSRNVTHSCRTWRCTHSICSKRVKHSRIHCRIHSTCARRFKISRRLRIKPYHAKCHESAFLDTSSFVHFNKMESTVGRRGSVLVVFVS